jgi:hypothetical protein
LMYQINATYSKIIRFQGMMSMAEFRISGSRIDIELQGLPAQGG